MLGLWLSHITVVMVMFVLWLSHIQVVTAKLCLWPSHIPLARLCLVCDWVTSRFPWLKYTLFFVTSLSTGKWKNFCKEVHNHHERADDVSHEFVREYVAPWYERSVLVTYQLHSLLKICTHILWIVRHIWVLHIHCGQAESTDISMQNVLRTGHSLILVFTQGVVCALHKIIPAKGFRCSSVDTRKKYYKC